jgi:hypothetical protein
MRAEYQALALEHTTDDLFDVAERAARFHECYLLTLEMLADRERRLKLSRECYARLRDENRRLRASIMQADMKRAA